MSLYYVHFELSPVTIQILNRPLAESEYFLNTSVEHCHFNTYLKEFDFFF